LSEEQIVDLNETDEPKKKDRITIAFSYPFGNGFEHAWINSVIGLMLYEASKKPEDRILGSILPAGSCYVSDNRTKIALDFCNKTQDSHVMMVDPDVAFELDILERFKKHIEANPEARIIAARVDLLNGFPVFYKVDKVKLMNMQQPFIFDGLKEFDLVGTGIICIARSVFEEMSFKEGHNHFFHRTITGPGIRAGDDFSFCMRAHKHGIKVYGAWDIKGTHFKGGVPIASRYPEKYEDLCPQKFGG